MIRALCPPPPDILYTRSLDDDPEPPLGNDWVFTFQIENLVGQPPDTPHARLSASNEYTSQDYELNIVEDEPQWSRIVDWPGTRLDPPDWDVVDLTEYEMIAEIAVLNASPHQIEVAVDFIILQSALSRGWARFRRVTGYDPTGEGGL